MDQSCVDHRLRAQRERVSRSTRTRRCARRTSNASWLRCSTAVPEAVRIARDRGEALGSATPRTRAPRGVDCDGAPPDRPADADAPQAGSSAQHDVIEVDGIRDCSGELTIVQPVVAPQPRRCSAAWPTTRVRRRIMSPRRMLAEVVERRADPLPVEAGKKMRVDARSSTARRRRARERRLEIFVLAAIHALPTSPTDRAASSRIQGAAATDRPAATRTNGWPGGEGLPVVPDCASVLGSRCAPRQRAPARRVSDPDLHVCIHGLGHRVPGRRGTAPSASEQTP